MDNFHIDVVSEGDDAFKTALGLCRWRTIVGYRADKKRMVLYWSHSDAKGYVALPYEMTKDQAAIFALGWLGSADYSDEPDHDGDNSKGWRIYNESWGHVDGDPYAFVAIEPAWAMYGK